MNIFLGYITYIMETLGREGVPGVVTYMPYVMLAFFGYFYCYNSKPPTTEDYARYTFQRRNLDRIRTRSGQFPKPYPNGWYRVCGTHDLVKGQVLSITCCGREMVAFRGEDGRAGVLHAFCPHLGTHLGHGGTVQGNNIVCPYHSWEFDADGTNKCIPYCNRDMGHSTRVNARKYETRERLNNIFVWYHAAEKPPDYELLVLDEMEDPKEGFRYVTTVDFDDWNMHIMEPSQNSADWYHFKTVHQWMCQSEHAALKVLKVDHVLDAQYGTDRKNEGTDMPKQLLLIQETIDGMKLFGIFPLPGFLCQMMDTKVRVLGPQTIIFCVDNWLLGKFRGIFTLTPEEPFLQKSRVSCWASWWWPWPLARLLLFFVMHTANQDRKVWEHKSHVSPRNLVNGDGPFAAYGKWLEQFYCEESEGYEDKSIDW